MALAERAPATDKSSGFTLLELLVVMAIIVLVLGAVPLLYRSASPGQEVKALARQTASRLRDLRALAMATQTQRVATIDTAARRIGFSDNRAPILVKTPIGLTVTAAEDAARSPTRARIRFYPNGSSSGATLAFRSGVQNHEVRINWLTGRVSTQATP
ncbi:MULTISPECIES: prepilin-type N-terminal cleavage/methylation domain-containing protein [Rhodomicrobium]|uniref:prepilin-type N-terminal cleavage/methylation domain-containing protein n=1 Tax=Rhodomicrobium TaxID=1068 RepID=UPI000B4BA466|nr:MULTISPECIES: prepilin-type N-terminal cleavage/methylation domain-containing protein [Rhodomicrobium]